MRDAKTLVENIRGWSVIKLTENDVNCASIHAEHMTCKERNPPRKDVCYSWEWHDEPFKRSYDETNRTKKVERCYMCESIVPEGIVAIVLFHNWEKLG